MRCHTNEWKIGQINEADDNRCELGAWLNSLVERATVNIGVFACAKYLGWENWVWSIDVELYTDELHRHASWNQNSTSDCKILRETVNHFATVECLMGQIEEAHMCYLPGIDSASCVDEYTSIQSEGRHLTSTADFDLWVERTQSTIDSISKDCRSYFLLRYHHANGLYHRYKSTKDISYLDAAIVNLQQQLEEFSHRYKSTHYDGMISIVDKYSEMLVTRYSETYDIKDLNVSIYMRQKRLEHTIKYGTPDIDNHILLAKQIILRYLRVMAKADVDDSINLAYALYMSEGYINFELYQRREIEIALIEALLLRQKREKTSSDAEMAIKVATAALENSLSSDICHWINLKGLLAGALIHRFAVHLCESDINESIRHLEESAKMSMERQIAISGHSLCQLGMAYEQRYLVFGKDEDLDTCIDNFRLALKDSDSQNRVDAALAAGLADALYLRFSKRFRREDLKDALSCFFKAFLKTGYTVYQRIRAAGIILSHCKIEETDNDKTYNIAHATTLFLEELQTKVLPTSDKLHVMQKIHGVASTAAAAVLHVGKSPAEAVVHLEKGRNLMLRSLEARHIDMEKLQLTNPELAKSFIETQGTLYRSTTTSRSDHDSPAWGTRRFLAQGELQNLIEAVRQDTDFADFLATGTFEDDLIISAKDGPIVIINVSVVRCDAFIIQSSGITGLELKDIHINNLESRVVQNALGDQNTLQWLWDTITEPILDVLGFTEPPAGDEWPHVWWIPTGLLSRFPLHAAGYHIDGSRNTVMDRVMSSYATSVKSILNGRQKQHPITQTKPPALIISMPTTPGMGVHLKSADEEAATVRKFCQAMEIEYSQSCYTQAEVCEKLRHCSIFHFAGHGYTNTEDPSQSHIRLNDWQTSPLTVEKLLDMNLWQEPPFLAFLSACGTGRAGENGYTDESVHLIGGCKLAGFRHVIGALWDVKDSTCVEVASLMYDVMRDKGLTDESVCLGLHLATRELRKKWLANIQENRQGAHRASRPAKNSAVSDSDDADETLSRLARDVTLIACIDEDNGDSSSTGPPADWIPYVHFGV